MKFTKKCLKSCYKSFSSVIIERNVRIRFQLAILDQIKNIAKTVKQKGTFRNDREKRKFTESECEIE